MHIHSHIIRSKLDFEMHIVIAGNIGSGKTTLTQLLAKHYGWEARFEQVDFNPYMEDYYKDIGRWSFNMEVFFLKERFRDLIEINQAETTVIQDRSIFEGVYVFAANNKSMGNMSDRDYETYMELFEDMLEVVRHPDLMIYLRASVPHLVRNIERRGRDYEQLMPLEYITNLNERYDDFVYNKYRGKVITFNVDNMDYQHNPKDLRVILNKIEGELFGLFKESDFD